MPYRIVGIGNDIVEVDRLKKAIQRQGQKFLDRIYTEAEQTYCLRYQESARHFAGRFAAKEAIVKALGTGFREGITWQDIEIVNDSQGKPIVRLSESVNKIFNDPEILLSISHCHAYAMATALWQTRD